MEDEEKEDEFNSNVAIIKTKQRKGTGTIKNTIMKMSKPKKTV